MTTSTNLARRLAGGLCIAALALAGCGDDDATTDAAGETTTPAAPETCVDRLVAFGARPDVVEAARTGAAELPAEAQAENLALEADCEDELAAMSEEELDAIWDRMDPEVVAYLTTGQAHEFEKTGESISGM
jgi:hypothetical protein